MNNLCVNSTLPASANHAPGALKAPGPLPGALLAGAQEKGAGFSAASAAACQRILLVDDSILSRTLLKRSLENAGYQVSCASDGNEAWGLLQGDAPDLVISDAMMPDMDGYQLTARIKGDPRTASLPVILISGLENSEDQQRAYDLGAQEYLHKTANILVDLLETVQRVLG